MPEKPPYRLTIKLDGAKPERITEALTALRETAADHDQSGDVSATMTLEGYQEAPLRAVMDIFEEWLYRHAQGLDCEMGLKRPGIRPETIAMRMREKQTTPMDQLLRNGGTITLGREHFDALQQADAQLRGAGDENLFDDDEADDDVTPPTADFFANNDGDLEDRDGNRRPMTAAERQAWHERA